MTDSPSDEETEAPATSGVSEISRLVRRGDLEGLGRALANPIPADHASACGWTALAEAAWTGHAEAARLLVNAGLDANTPSIDGLTPLMIAASQGHLHMVRFLCASGARVDRRTRDGRTAMESALQAARVEVAGLLRQQGAPLDGPLAALFVRAICARQGTACALVDPTDQVKQKSKVWRWVMARPLVLGPELIAPLSACLADGEPLPVASAVELQVNRLRLRTSVEFVVDPDHPALRTASALPSSAWRYRSGWTEHVQRILHGEVTADTPDRFGYLPLLEAIRNGPPRAVQALLALGADPNTLPHYGCMRGASMLINAAERGDPTMVSLLLEAGADLNRESATGWTALMVAASRGREAAVRCLVQAGASLEARNAQGQTALALAQRRRHARVARLLLVANNAGRIPPRPLTD